MPDNPEGERRQGALETARALGELTALVRSVGDNQQRAYAEMIRITSDQQAQLHEVKHGQAQASQLLSAFDERLKAHADEVRETRDQTTRNLATELAAHRQMVVGELSEVKRITSITQQQVGDLMLWRNKVLGGLAIIGILITIFWQTIARVFSK